MRLDAVAEVVPGFEEGDLAPHPIYLAAALGSEVLGSCVEVWCYLTICVVCKFLITSFLS